MVSFDAVNVMSPRTPTHDMLVPVRPACGMAWHVIIIISEINRQNIISKSQQLYHTAVLPLTDEDELYLVKLLNARMRLREREWQEASQHNKWPLLGYYILSDTKQYYSDCLRSYIHCRRGMRCRLM